MMTTCPFCDRAALRIRLENVGAVAIPDAYPVAAGHTLPTVAWSRRVEVD